VTVTNVLKNPEALTMTVTSEFDATIERVWQMWGNPRLLERWWGPPTYPATFVNHDLVPDGTVTYFMTAPEGEKYHGWWRVIAVDAPRSLEVEDGFADGDGVPNTELPITVMRMHLEEFSAGRTRMTLESRFASLEQMDQLVAMGMEEGLQAALGQMDALLAD
jgi:uncharacterized protein YndB with AHSA1/START domain